ncbi:Polyketide biosynthesis cytochrome P450 PksS [Streptomyces sp. RB5]|uniref:Polyketide biosynthesis cytochrome P450 PksS n=1 Tax=Streptomyces smaragdinus TaxID=2585196 RepID=A0A7K0CDG7_9ACTN|nr:cytochrome P450 [Streptomyces smaragdinus]MQY11403.1 Polyketide biosynthesis cytochrome P450 PksS [Streptomyces smaragdinus]
MSNPPPKPAACPVVQPGAVPLSGARFHTEPQQLYREVRREHGPVVPVELLGGFPAWLVIGYRELHQVTSDPELFPRDSSLWNQWEHIPEDWPLLPMISRPMPSIYFTSGADHRRHANLVEPALEAVDAFELRRACEELADRLIDSFCGRGEAELLAAFAKPLPILALARIVGFPDEEGTQLADVMNELADGGPGAQQAYMTFFGLIQKLAKEKRANPGGDVTSWMYRHGDGFTDEEVMLDAKDITAAGFLPTADWIGNSIRLMLTDDRFASALGGGRFSVAQAMNEVLWEDSPTQILSGRWASRDTHLAGRSIRSGDLVLLGLAGANADPQIQQHLTPAQGGNSAHFAFSYGDYRCPFPAQEIAEIIARTGIEVLLDRLPDLELSVPVESLVRRESAFLRGMQEIPVRFTPVRTTGGLS